ncbi:hypothetical protein ABBQ32_007118 [Trebouxia sp. C0010 RCD-2024]
MADSDASHTAAAAQAASGSANTAARHAPRTKGTAATQAMLEHERRQHTTMGPLYPIITTIHSLIQVRESRVPSPQDGGIKFVAAPASSLKA